MAVIINKIDGTHKARIVEHNLEYYTCDNRLIRIPVRTDYVFLKWDKETFPSTNTIAMLSNGKETFVLFRNGVVNVFRNEDKLLLDYEVVKLEGIKELTMTYTQIGAYNYGGKTHRLYVDTKEQNLAIVSNYDTYARLKVFKPYTPLPLDLVNYNYSYALALDALKNNPEDEGIYVVLGSKLIGGDMFEKISSCV